MAILFQDRAILWIIKKELEFVIHLIYLMVNLRVSHSELYTE